MDKKTCSKCKIEKSINDFYKYKTKARNWCKECDKINTIIRQTVFKELCVEYKGGKCEKCGYDKYIGALEFHHKNPSQKKFSISDAKLKKFDDEIKTELDKCEILCANCHSESHQIHNVNILQEKWDIYNKQKEYIQKATTKKNIILITCSCGNTKSKKSNQCLKCANKKAIERNIDEVIAKVKETNWTKAGKFFGVTDNSLRKFVKKHGINPKKITNRDREAM